MRGRSTELRGKIPKSGSANHQSEVADHRCTSELFTHICYALPSLAAHGSFAPGAWRVAPAIKTRCSRDYPLVHQ